MIILDTDFVYSLFFEGQSTHNIAVRMSKLFLDSELILTNFVKFELATVLSKRESHQVAMSVIEDLIDIDNVRYYRLTEDDEYQTYKLFCTYSRKNISFVDCSNLFISQKSNFKIASFDKFYPKPNLLNL
jgi:predicted nucleic acid-binding protein